MRIKKSVINAILENYSTRSKEFEPLEGIEGAYKSIYTKGYIIKIEPERNGDLETGRILVHHSNSRGRRTFTDIWEKEKRGSSFYWMFRNPASVPISDAEYIRDITREIEEVKTAARKQREDLESLRAGTDKRPVGRPKDNEKEEQRRAGIRKMLKAGCKDMEIMHDLKLCKGTYYRIKKIIQSEK